MKLLGVGHEGKNDEGKNDQYHGQGAGLVAIPEYSASSFCA